MSKDRKAEVLSAFTVADLDNPVTVESIGVALENAEAEEKTVCKCGHGCDYPRTVYEKTNDLGCSNSRMEMPCAGNNCGDEATAQGPDGRWYCTKCYIVYNL